MPDIPDRIMEIGPDGSPRRVLSRGSTVYEGMRTEKVRSWFVGPDGLTEPEREAKALRKLLDLFPEIPDDPGTLPPWDDDQAGEHGADGLSHGKVARLIGEMGVAYLQASNAADGRPDDWPVGSWDGLANSSRWSCLRAGLKALAAMKETPNAD